MEYKLNLRLREAVAEERGLYLCQVMCLCIVCVCLHLILKRLQSAVTPAASALIPPLADLHMILLRLRAIWCSYLIMSEWSNGKQHSQDSSQWIMWPLTWLGRTWAEALPLVLAAKQPAMCVSKIVCVCGCYSFRLCFIRPINVCVYVCSRVTESYGAVDWQPRVWTPHASFIPLTSDKAEALLVMMWLLLPIMPRCRPGRKTVQYILLCPSSAAYGGQHFAALLWRHLLTHSWDVIHRSVLHFKVWYHHIILSEIRNKTLSASVMSYRTVIVFLAFDLSC